jgi:hypothetical protein
MLLFVLSLSLSLDLNTVSFVFISGDLDTKPTVSQQADHPISIRSMHTPLISRTSQLALAISLRQSIQAGDLERTESLHPPPV